MDDTGLTRYPPDAAYGMWGQGIFIGKLFLLWCFVGVLLLTCIFCCIKADGGFARTHIHSLMSRAGRKRGQRERPAAKFRGKLD